MQRPIKWLHLSDIHLGHRGIEVWHQVQDEFRDSLLSQIAHAGPPDLVLITGDLAYSGRMHEYILVDLLVQNILADIRESFPNADPIVVPAPGNHDVCWPAENSRTFS